MAICQRSLNPYWKTRPTEGAPEPAPLPQKSFLFELMWHRDAEVRAGVHCPMDGRSNNTKADDAVAVRKRINNTLARS